MAAEALSQFPLVKAGGADAAGIESIPLVATVAAPAVVLAGRPTAERATDARWGRAFALVVFGFAIWNCCRFVCNLSHP